MNIISTKYGSIYRYYHNIYHLHIVVYPSIYRFNGTLEMELFSTLKFKWNLQSIVTT